MKSVVHESESLFPLMERRIPPHQSHSKTSLNAALQVQPRIGTQRFKVLEYIKSRGTDGACDFEGIRDMQKDLPTAANAYRARRIELENAGLILKAEFTRRSPSGAECDVWIATEFFKE